MRKITSLFLALICLLCSCAYSFNEYQDPWLLECHTAEEISNHYDQKFNEAHVRQSIRRTGDHKTSTTMRHHIYWRKDWEILPIEKKARTKAHEYVHILQWEDEENFEFEYLLNEEARLDIELAGYGAGVRAIRSMGQSKKEATIYITFVANIMYKEYKFIVYDKQKLHAKVYKELQKYNKKCK